MGKTALIGALVMAVWSTSTLAQSTPEIVKWGQVGGWQVRVDRTVGDGCFAMQVYERGSVVRIGFDAEAKQIYLFFAHDDWKSLEEGKIYPVRVVFDGGVKYDGEMKGQKIGNIVLLAHRNLSTAFVKDFMERTDMEVFYRGERISYLSLRNTYAAVSEILNCQRELGFAGRGGSDRKPASSSDPFNSPRPDRTADPFSK